MASTFTDVGQIEKPGIGEQDNTWGDTLNANFDLIDKSLFQFADIDMTGASDVTPALSVWVNPVLTLSGTIAADINLILPAEEKWWFIENATSGSFSITAKTSGGSGVTLTQGEWAIIRGDGTNIEKIPLGVGGGGTGGTSIATALAALKAPYSAVTTQTAATLNTAAADRGKLIECNCTSNAITVNLLAVATAGAGFMLAVTKTDSSANAVTIDGASAETINGATTITLTTQDEFAILICDGTEWWALRAVEDGSITLAKLSTTIINAMAAITAPAIGDEMAVADVSDSNLNRKITLANMLKVINGLTEDTTPDVDADFVLSYDTSASAVKKVKPANLAAGGNVKLLASTHVTATVSGTTTMAIDNTIPQQSSDGVEVMTLACTPENAASQLVIEVGALLANSSRVNMGMALFVDATENALRAVYEAGGDNNWFLHMSHRVATAGSGARTYKVKAGASGAGTTYLNANNSGTDLFGGVAGSYMRVWEILP